MFKPKRLAVTAALLFATAALGGCYYPGYYAPGYYGYAAPGYYAAPGGYYGYGYHSWHRGW